MNKSKNFSINKLLIEILSLGTALLVLTPVIWAFFVSLKREGTPIKNTWQWFAPPYTFENYPNILFNSKVLVWMLNSVFVAVVVTVFVVILSAMCAFALSKIQFRYKKFMILLFLAGLMVPGEATIIPLFVTAKDLNLIDTYAGIILPALAGSMNIIIMMSFFNSIPNDLIESARIDGANNIKIFISVMMPLCKTVVVTVSIFTFIGNWNSFLWPYLCAMDESLFTLPVGIPTFMGQYTQDYVLPMTANMVASLPVIIIFLLFEKQIVKGISLSGIKG